MKFRTLPITLLSLTIILFTNCGNSGHYKISLNIAENLPEEMNEFRDWNIYLAEHGSDADWRKGDDPTEGPKHYIDIDNYPEFLESGEINQDLEYLISLHGESFIDDNGYLPWATLTSYDSLVVCLKRKDWDKAKFFAADLGHYVADGFMPLHITRNYNGQFSGNNGIHGRYESDMINKFKDQIEMKSLGIDDLENVPDYIFDYLYASYEYVDSVLYADNYGKKANSNTSSNEYLSAMWEYSAAYTSVLFNHASKAFATLFYEAWKEAGKPSLLHTGSKDLSEKNTELISLFPNPVMDKLLIKINSNTLSDFECILFNSGGKIMQKRSLLHYPMDNGFLSMDVSNFFPGNYFFMLKGREGTETRSFMIIR